MTYNELTCEIIGAGIRVHRELGPGLLEKAYEPCMAWEFVQRGISFEQQKRLPVSYHGMQLKTAYELDFLVDGRVVVELKAVRRLTRLHSAQLLTYLKLTDCRVGLLINFNVPVLKEGIRRHVRNL